MIIQTSNNPLLITFNESVENVKELRITLWNESTKLKEWTKEDVEIDDTVVTCPLTQNETKAFPKCNATLEIKWLDNNDTTNFTERLLIKISDRNDKEIMNND